MRTTPPPNIQLKTVAQRRARIKPDLKAKLEEEYKKNSKPSKSEKHRIALQNDMSDDNVHFWFQNRRARASREAKHAGNRDRSIHGLTVTSSGSFTTPGSHRTVMPQDNQAPATCLPPIISLLANEGEPTTGSNMPIIKSFFYHNPYGIESSFLSSQAPQPSTP